jgi:4-hydroxy-tetrahydrodipicolinate reductase
MSLSVLLIGHGRMGRLVEALAGEHGASIAGIVTRANASDTDGWPAADVAIDFSTAAASVRHVPALARRGMAIVLGTTGWQADEAALREAVARHRIGIVAAANFAVGVNVFLAVAERTAALMAGAPAFEAWIHELHHSAKRDAPSGTALALEAALRRGGYTRAVDVASTRAGSIPGTHTVGFDAPAETLTLTHTARDRTAFARGALEAARWVHGRQGWFTMRDVLGISWERPG